MELHWVECQCETGTGFRTEIKAPVGIQKAVYYIFVDKTSYPFYPQAFTRIRPDVEHDLDMTYVVMEMGKSMDLGYIVYAFGSSADGRYVSGLLVHLHLVTLVTVCKAELETEIGHVSEHLAVSRERELVILGRKPPALGIGWVELHAVVSGSGFEAYHHVVVGQGNLAYIHGIQINVRVKGVPSGIPLRLPVIGSRGGQAGAEEQEGQKDILFNSDFHLSILE